MKFTTEKLKSSQLKEFLELIHLFEVVFEMKPFVMPRREHLAKLLADTEFIVFTARVSGEIAGGLTAYVLDQYVSERPLVYIYDLAVAGRYQRKGIGRKLIEDLKHFSKTIGAEEVFVQADEVDLHAVEFYRATQGRPEKVIHYYYPL